MHATAKQNAVHLPMEMSSGPEVNDVHLGALMHQALEATRTSYKEAAIAVGVPPSYFTAMLNGEKPWRLAQIKALPDPVERVFSRLYAESMGLVVVEPSDEQRVMANVLTALGEMTRTMRLRQIEPGDPIRMEPK